MGLFKKDTSQIAILKIASNFFEKALSTQNIAFKILPLNPSNYVVYEYTFTKYNQTMVLFAVKDAYENSLVHSNQITVK